MKNCLVIIDPQKDFCSPTGSLFVPRADEDITRLAKLIKRSGKLFQDISVTLDSHNRVHIAHPIWWSNSKGNHPDPFTIITEDEVNNGEWFASNPGLRKLSRDYVSTLARNGRYSLCIWPEHCLIGSEGCTIVPELHEALHEWTSPFNMVNFITKGSNPTTEHYSAIMADVPDPTDPHTQVNTEFITRLLNHDNVYASGEALSHCVANTFEDIANQFGNDSLVSKIILLEDTCSNVPGFDHLGQTFLNNMKVRGMRTCLSTDL